MPFLYVPLEIEPCNVVPSTMPTNRHTIHTVLANFRRIGSGMRRLYRGGVVLSMVLFEGDPEKRGDTWDRTT